MKRMYISDKTVCPILHILELDCLENLVVMMDGPSWLSNLEISHGVFGAPLFYLGD